MTVLLLTLSLMCPVSRIVDKTSSWGTTQDLEALRIAKKGCLKYYEKDAPCLKQFIKVEEGVYRAICGLEDK